MKDNDKTCLWEDVTSKLTAYIDKNALKPGSAFFSTNEVSKRFGVSDITSRRALTELVNMNLIERSRGRGCIIKKQHTVKTVFVMAGDIELQSFVYSELYKGILEGCREHNIKTKVISLAFMDNFPENTRMDLVLLQNFPTHVPDVCERLINDKNINCVCCHALKPIDGITTVRSNLGEGAYDIVSYLIEKGRKRIAYIGGGNSCWAASRFDGYYRALRENGMDIDTNNIKTVESGSESHFKAMDELMKQEYPPDAIFNVSDTNALLVLEYCQQNGIKVPEDLAVAGFDNFPETMHSNPPLTTVDTMLEEEGREAIRLLLQSSGKSDIKDIVLKPKLVRRKSI